MPIASPRASFRGEQPVPDSWPDTREHAELISRAVQLLQERARLYPVEAVSITASYTALDEDLIILANATSGDITVTLPTAAAREGRRYIVKKTDSSSNLVTVDAAGTETIDGDLTRILSTQYAVCEIVSDGTNWHQLSSYGSSLSFSRSYSLRSGAGDTGTFWLAGQYEAPPADANLTQASTTQTLGTANLAYGAHAFLVAAAAGTASGGSGAVTITVTGTSINDAGTRATSDTETIVSDITAMSTNEYFETVKKWIGQVTYTLDVGATGHTAYAADFNYGFAKYDDFGNRNFELTDFEVVGFGDPNPADGGLEISLLLHSTTGWTYSAAAFVPGGTVIADMVTDYVTETGVDGSFAYKRANLNQSVGGATAEEGFIIKIVTTRANAIEQCDAHIIARIG